MTSLFFTVIIMRASKIYFLRIVQIEMIRKYFLQDKNRRNMRLEIVAIWANSVSVKWPLYLLCKLKGTIRKVLFLFLIMKDNFRIPFCQVVFLLACGLTSCQVLFFQFIQHYFHQIKATIYNEFANNELQRSSFVAYRQIIQQKMFEYSITLQNIVLLEYEK